MHSVHDWFNNSWVHRLFRLRQKSQAGNLCDLYGRDGDGIDELALLSVVDIVQVWLSGVVQRRGTILEPMFGRDYH